MASAGFHVDLGMGLSPSDSPVLTPTDTRPKQSPSTSKQPGVTLCMPPLPPLLPPLNIPPPPPPLPPLALPPPPPPPPPPLPLLERLIDFSFATPSCSASKSEEMGYVYMSPLSSESSGSSSSSLYTSGPKWSPVSQKNQPYGALPPIVAPSNPMSLYTSVQRPPGSTPGSALVPSSVLLHRQSFHPTVVASPLKTGTSSGGGDRDRELLAPPLTAKRLRLTRNSRGNSVDHEDHIRGND